ncbi:Flp pilus assembly protein TadG [Catenulispora sp. GAS73]|uniref:TadE family protein n=1 Tax=Catenulispora sp. GAS73 TaxID=3156269 RepID=UPI003510FC54
MSTAPRAAGLQSVLRARAAALRAAPEAGSTTIELTLLAPIFILLFLLVVALGRVTDAHSKVQDAAFAAARAATLAPNANAAASAAQSAASQSLADAGVVCQSFSVQASVGSLAPGSTVSVHVDCTVGLADVAGLRLPGASTQSATSVSVVDQFRSSPAGSTTP